MLYYNLQHMNIIIPDIDNIIINFIKLPDLLSLMATSHYYYALIKDRDIIQQWDQIKTHNLNPRDKFYKACELGYIAYIEYLICAHNIKPCNQFFLKCCRYNQLATAKFLLSITIS